MVDNMADNRSSRLWCVGSTVILLLLANGLLLVEAPILARAIGVLVLTVGLPGLLLTANLFSDLGRASPWPLRLMEWIGLSAGLGLASAIVVALLLSYLPGGMPLWLPLVAFDLLVVVLLVALWRSEVAQSGNAEDGASVVTEETTPNQDELGFGRYLPIAGLLILLLVGGYLRLANNGYAEFQGDEARAMLRGAAVVQGYEDVLFIHRKGPTEILLPAIFYSLLGQMNEQVARLPFALANLAGLVMIWALGWRIFGTGRPYGWLIGWLAAMLLAVDGYFIGFARIVQYQSVVFLLSVLVVWLLVRTLDTPEIAKRSLPVAAFLLGAGLLSHYEAGLVALPGLVFLWLWFGGKADVDETAASENATSKNEPKGEGVVSDSSRRQAQTTGRGPGKGTEKLASFGMALLILLGVVLLFYLPFVLNPTFDDTYRYLAESRVGVGGSFPYNNLADFWTRSTLYSTSLYILLLGALGFLGLALAIAAFFSSRSAQVGTATWAHRERGSTILDAPRQVGLLAMLGVWWLGPFSLAMFFTAEPRTHVYTSFFGWVLLAAWGSGCIPRLLKECFGWRINRRTLGIAGTLITLILFGYFGRYAYWYFVHVDDEILRSWETERLAGYPITYDLPTRQGIFGFPMKNGWDAVKGLYMDGALDGSYLTNTKPHVVNWYLRNVDFCTRNHRYYFFVEDNNLYKRAENQALRQQLQSDYTHWGTILVEGNQRLEIYDNQGPSDATFGDNSADLPFLFPVEHFEAELSDRFSDAYFDITEPYVTAQLSPIAQEQTDLRLTDPTTSAQIELLGYSIDKRVVEPGKSLLVTFYWQAGDDDQGWPTGKEYTVFNQIIDLESNTKMGQLDARPGCDGRPTSIWAPGDVVVDRHRVAIAADAAEGDYPLIAGVYDSETGTRFDVTDGAGEPLGNSVTLGTITISRKGESAE